MPKVVITGLDDRDDFTIEAKELILVGTTEDEDGMSRVFAFNHSTPIFNCVAAQVATALATKRINDILGELGSEKEE